MSGTSHDPDSTSVAEFSGHIKGRPVSWVVVVVVCGGFVAAGVGLVAALPWLFFVGLGVVVVGSILGWVPHAMADATARVETAARRRDAAESVGPRPTTANLTAAEPTAHPTAQPAAPRAEEPAAH
jgi:hypothetical protein